MPAAIKVPTVFSAEDKFSKVVKKMTQGVKKFSKNSIAAVQRFDNRITKTFNKLGKFTGIALGLGIGAVFATAIQNNIAYDKSIQSIQAVTGKSGKEFDRYREKIIALGNSQKILYADIAKSMEIVGSAQPELLKNADGLAKVTDATLTLAKAGNLSQEEAALSLTSVMNQFGAGADEAIKYIDILATSEKKGSSIIKNTADALIVAGGTAKAFGLSFEDSNAFIQAFAKGGKLGSEAGTQFSGVLSKLSKVQDKRFNPAFTNAFDVIQNLKNANLSYNDLLKLTDSQGAKWITTLLNQNKTLQELRGNLNDKNAALDAANTKTNTFAAKLQEVKDTFKNLTTATDNNSKSMNFLKKILEFVEQNMDKVIIAAISILGAFVLMKTVIGIIKAIQIAIQIWTAVQWLLNASLWANPIGVVIAAIIALIAIVVGVIAVIRNWGSITDWFSKKWEQFTKWISSLWSNVVNFFTEFDFKKMFMGIGKAIISFMLMPLKWVLMLLAKLPGKVGRMAQAGLDKINEVTGNVEVKKEIVPSTAVATSEQITKKVTENNNNLNVNIKDPGNNIDGVSSDNDIPVNITNTQGAS